MGVVELVDGEKGEEKAEECEFIGECGVLTDVGGY